MTVPTHKSELLMPAGLIDKLKIAILYCSRKNKLEVDGVLEFVPPTSRETILLRLYEFKHATTGKITAVVHPGHTLVFHCCLLCLIKKTLRS